MKRPIVLISVVSVVLLVLLGFGLLSASSMECVQTTGTGDPEVKWRYDCHFDLFKSKHPIGSTPVVRRRFGWHWQWGQRPEHYNYVPDAGSPVEHF